MMQAGKMPDPWQVEVLTSPERQLLLLGSRQCGKTLACAALVLAAALKPNSLVLVLGPSDRQSKEFLRKVMLFWMAAGRPEQVSGGDTTTKLELANGSRVIALPDSEGTIRNYSDVALLCIDEASRVSDELYLAVRPMLAVSGGRIAALSTPFGRRGWFWEAYQTDPSWRKWTVTAEQAPRVLPFMEQEKANGMPERYLEQEFFCRFLDPLDAVFRGEDIQALVQPGLRPAFAWD